MPCREPRGRERTLGAAAAAFLDGETGTVEVGKHADLVVLSEDPFADDGLREPGRAERIRTKMTFVDGVLAYRRTGSDIGEGG